AGERRRGDDRRAGLHDSREAPDPEHDAVDVRGDRAAEGLVLERGDVAGSGGDAGVEEREVDGADALPRERIGDVEAVAEVEHLDPRALALEQRRRRGADPGGAAGDERATEQEAPCPYGGAPRSADA